MACEVVYNSENDNNKITHSSCACNLIFIILYPCIIRWYTAVILGGYPSSLWHIGFIPESCGLCIIPKNLVQGGWNSS